MKKNRIRKSRDTVPSKCAGTTISVANFERAGISVSNYSVIVC
jgi:hypothetical protein